MRHTVPARIAAIAVVLVAAVGLAHASTPGCPSTHCLFVPLVRQEQAEPLPNATATPTSALISTASPTPSSTPMATPTPTTTATVTATATLTATSTAPVCVVPDFIGLRRSQAPTLWSAANFTGPLNAVSTGSNYAIGYQSLPAGSSVVCSAAITVGP
jgi:hypothetical protein